MATNTDSNVNIESKELFSIRSKAINGLVASAMGIAVVFPLDLVKTRLQAQITDQTNPSSPLFPFTKQIIQKEGFLGLYKGFSVSFFFVCPEKSLHIVSNDIFLHILSKEASKEIPVSKQLLAGCLTDICSIIILTPLELVKIQMQTNTNSVGRKSTISEVRKAIKDRGLLGLYKGSSAGVYRDILFSTVHFPLFKIMNDYGKEKKVLENTSKTIWSLLSGCVAGGVAALSATPFDVVKTRLQYKYSFHYKGTLHAIWTIATTEGVTAIFKGGLCRVLVLTPMFGILQAVYTINLAEHIFGIR